MDSLVEKGNEIQLQPSNLNGETGFPQSHSWYLAKNIMKQVATIRKHHKEGKTKTKLRGFGLRANYADRATAACWRSSANFCG
jgi:hypothetical protein